MKVYRNGPLVVGSHSRDIATVWEEYDAIKPSQRTGRMDSIYASPTLTGMVRWLQTNAYNQAWTGKTDLKNYEITVTDVENIYVYDIELYESTAMKLYCYGGAGDPSYQSFNEEMVEPYWNSGIKLSDWGKLAHKRKLNAMQWEVLLPQDNIFSCRELSTEEILNATPEYLRPEIEAIFHSY